KQIALSIFLLLITAHVKADSCRNQQLSFEKEEIAYDTVARIAVAGNSAYAIIERFVEEGDALLTACPNVYSLDRQYILKRKLKKARQHQQSYKVFSQSNISSYARTHPEEIIVYKWGTIRAVE
ncbi:hypothetical protein, partial [Sulfurovum sp.]|uniref:hypothetical protein n=1 Tax=Sulfurovum sp. TaxID=1969726 RepID=UPI003564C8BF